LSLCFVNHHSKNVRWGVVLDITELLSLCPELLHSLSKVTVSAEVAVGEAHTHSKCIEEEGNPSLLPGIEI